LPVKTTRLLVLTHADTGEILLEKRPPSGIWGGLWSLPEADVDASVDGVCEQRWGFKVLHNEDDTPFRHTFSHYHLDITPCRVHVQEDASAVAETGTFSWCTTEEAQGRALAAPIARIISEQRKA
jgi:A/G-specific adenine glycosylase